MFYKFLGWSVWQAAKWYARQQLPTQHPFRNAAIGAVLGGTVVAVVLGSRRASSS